MNAKDKTLAQCSFRPLLEQDIPLMFEWIQNPHVAWWWQTGTDWLQFVEKYQDHIASDYIFPFIMQVDNKPIGYIQYYYANMVDIDWYHQVFGEDSSGVVGIDIFIGNPDYFAKGYGSIFMQNFIEELWTKPGIKKIIVDPQPENLQAVKCFEKLGFEPVCKDNIFYMELSRAQRSTQNADSPTRS